MHHRAVPVVPVVPVTVHLIGLRAVRFRFALQRREPTVAGSTNWRGMLGRRPGGFSLLSVTFQAVDLMKA